MLVITLPKLNFLLIPVSNVYATEVNAGQSVCERETERERERLTCLPVGSERQ